MFLFLFLLLLLLLSSSFCPHSCCFYRYFNADRVTSVSCRPAAISMLEEHPLAIKYIGGRIVPNFASFDFSERSEKISKIQFDVVGKNGRGKVYAQAQAKGDGGWDMQSVVLEVIKDDEDVIKSVMIPIYPSKKTFSDQLTGSVKKA